MKLREYEEIYKQLHHMDDVEGVSRRFNVPKDALMSILMQKLVRHTMSQFYKVKARSKELHGEWVRGKSFMEISQMCRLAPMLCASFILQERGYSKKKYRHAVKNVHAIKDERLRKDLAEAIKHDFLYSDWAAEGQRERGEMHERALGDWVKGLGLEFWTEKERAGEEKTPDFLLKHPAQFHGKTVHWFESKGYFGDPSEIRRSYLKQFKQYVELFGPGVVIYWLGFVEDAPIMREAEKHILFIDRSCVEKK